MIAITINISQTFDIFHEAFMLSFVCFLSTYGNPSLLPHISIGTTMKETRVRSLCVIFE